MLSVIHGKSSGGSCCSSARILNAMVSMSRIYVSMAKCKTAVTPLLTHWSYCSLAPSHWFVQANIDSYVSSEQFTRKPTQV